VGLCAVCAVMRIGYTAVHLARQLMLILAPINILGFSPASPSQQHSSSMFYRRVTASIHEILSGLKYCLS